MVGFGLGFEVGEGVVGIAVGDFVGSDVCIIVGLGLGSDVVVGRPVGSEVVNNSVVVVGPSQTRAKNHN